MFCSKCGSQIPDDSEFCPKCGTPVGGAAGGTGYGPNQNSGKKGTGCWIAAIITGVVFLLIIPIILAAIALPAYSRYTARAKFTEVTTAAGPLKQQVELCFFDLGTLAGGSNPDTGATSCSDDQWGTGWNLVKAVRETKSEYVQAASVKNGVISMTSRNISVYGNDSFTLILVPHQVAYGSGGDTALNWTIAPESTCKQAGIC